MSNFIENLVASGNVSFSGMRDTAMSMLPRDKYTCDKIYKELERGKGILDDDNHLNMYLKSFGPMHQAKLLYAFDTIPRVESIFSQKVEIYDWGCGQGTAIINFLDYLRAKGVTPNISNIHLIDPSLAAINRACDVIKYYDKKYSIRKITKEFDALTSEDFIKSNTRKIHLFSNILDVEFFDIIKFTQLFQESFKGNNFFICVGPYYPNNRRVDYFVAAITPDLMFATANKDRGTWKKDWTLSMRVFSKSFNKVESIADIRARIEEVQKQDQFFAGFILDAVADATAYGNQREVTEFLLKSLCTFDVKSNKPLNGSQSGKSTLAVLANIISRGLPTKAPILLEETFSELYNVSKKTESPSSIRYKSLQTIDPNSIYEAVHIVDPRFNFSDYNLKLLESDFERAFISSLVESQETSYIAQILEPQRALSSILEIPNRQFGIDQRVDFAFEVPDGLTRTGFIVELDGVPYHSNIFQRLKDEKRDRMTSSIGWDTYRLETLASASLISNWENDPTSQEYLSIVKKNYGKIISGDWGNTLQIVLAPLAIARIERILVEAIQSDALKTNADKWTIAIVERDIPCAALAIRDFQTRFDTLNALAGVSERIPRIDLSIISTEEFKDSALHLGENVETEIPYRRYDVCIDISILMRDKIDARPLKIKADTVYIIRSAHYNKKNRSVCVAKNIEYPPLVTKDTAGKYVNIFEREELLTFFLNDIFRKKSFRPGQLPILSNSLGNKTTIGLLPTGGGKSLTYQLSCMLQPGVSIIVDPLVSLMLDQVRGLKDIGIDCCDCINSTQTGVEKVQRLNRLQRGEVQLMLLSPERFMMENFRQSLMNMTEKNGISFAYGIIDEVHCVSEWGHDFRTSYLHLGRNMITYMRTKSSKPLSIIGLTATASFDVLADVERELTLGGRLSIDSEAIVRPEDDSRPELTYRIIPVHADFDELRDSDRPYLLNITDKKPLNNIVAKAKVRKLLNLFEQIPGDIKDLNCHGNESCSLQNFDEKSFYHSTEWGKHLNAGLIFCPHTKGVFGVKDNDFGGKGISSELTAERPELSIGTFIGGDKPSGDMQLFTTNDMGLMVATKAFGMGIDKPNIRYTINFSHPSSIESYVQEAGRAGRDKKNAISYLLYEDTDFIHLTADKIHDITRHFSLEYDLKWLDSYRNKYILRDDFYTLCSLNNTSHDIAKNVLLYLQTKGYIENVDKNIDLWFHNNSFRGLYKEKSILVEMTDRIQNAKPTILTQVQAKLRDALGNDDICLKINKNKTALSVISKEDSSKQYCYLFLDNLFPTFKFATFELEECRRVSHELIRVLQEYNDHSGDALSKPIADTDNINEGIYGALKAADNDGYVYVTVSWENEVQQNEEEFNHVINAKIDEIAKTQGWLNINVAKFGPLNFNRINSFHDLVSEISFKSNDTRWLKTSEEDKIFEKLKREFSRKRDKDDTDKCIYRMCCIGLVEDVTVDYLSETYELKIRKKSDEDYRQNMLDFFLKYYSREKAEEMVGEIDFHKGRIYLDKCLGYLTEFVYNTLKSKRLRAIEDIRIACEDGIKERARSGNDDWLKKFIHLYFNSKYARKGYMVGSNKYSLIEDIEGPTKSDFGIVKKYLNIVPKDPSGSEIDNAKHLYGATLLCLRAHPDNPILKLLLTYCIIFIGASDNETLKVNALNAYIEGFIGLYAKEKESIWKLIEQFNIYLKTKNESIKNTILKEGKEAISLLIHESELNDIVSKYLNG